MFIAGDKVPVTTLLEVEGKLDKVSPLQIGFTALKKGVIIGFLTLTNIGGSARRATSGVKV